MIRHSNDEGRHTRITDSDERVCVFRIDELVRPVNAGGTENDGEGNGHLTITPEDCETSFDIEAFADRAV